MKNKLNYPNIIWQPLLASIFIIAVLYVFSFARATDFTWAIGAGALASSSYLVFGMPSSRSAKYFNILGGYLVAIVCSVVVQYLERSLDVWCADVLHCATFTVSLVVSSIVVGLVLFVMAFFRCQHPPAAGLALTLVIDSRNTDILFFVLLSAALLSLVSLLLKKHLRDLVV